MNINITGDSNDTDLIYNSANSTIQMNSVPETLTTETPDGSYETPTTETPDTETPATETPATETPISYLNISELLNWDISLNRYNQEIGYLWKSKEELSAYLNKVITANINYPYIYNAEEGSDDFAQNKMGFPFNTPVDLSYGSAEDRLAERFIRFYQSLPAWPANIRGRGTNIYREPFPAKTASDISLVCENFDYNYKLTQADVYNLVCDSMLKSEYALYANLAEGDWSKYIYSMNEWMASLGVMPVTFDPSGRLSYEIGGPFDKPIKHYRWFNEGQTSGKVDVSSALLYFDNSINFINGLDYPPTRGCYLTQNDISAIDAFGENKNLASCISDNILQPVRDDFKFGDVSAMHAWMDMISFIFAAQLGQSPAAIKASIAVSILIEGALDLSATTWEADWAADSRNYDVSGVVASVDEIGHFTNRFQLAAAQSQIDFTEAWHYLVIKKILNPDHYPVP